MPAILKEKTKTQPFGDQKFLKQGTDFLKITHKIFHRSIVLTLATYTKIRYYTFILNSKQLYSIFEIRILIRMRFFKIRTRDRFKCASRQ